MVSYILIIVSVVFITLIWNDDRYICEILVINTIVALCITTGLFGIFKGKAEFYRIKFIERLGCSSLDIYLLHTYFVTAMRVICNRFGITNNAVIIISGTIIGIVGPLMISMLLRKLGLFELLFAPYDWLKKKKTEVYSRES